MSDSLTIDGVGPMPVERPQSVAEVCAIVRRCADTNTAVYPVGGGTMLDYGMPPARPGIALSLAEVDKGIDYPARDLTITVEAGITMCELQATLAAENQWLPVDAPDTATIGGAIACDISGPRRYGYGTLRDYVIGITVVNDQGEETHAGGRVVKNVAGYDMMKLHTGALGTLGVITQVTLKVKPKPEAWSKVVALTAPEHLQGTLEAVRNSATRPVIVDFARTRGNPQSNHMSCLIAATFEGGADAVASQAQLLEYELQTVNPYALETFDGNGPSFKAGWTKYDPLSFRATIPSNAAFQLMEIAIQIPGMTVEATCGGAVVRGTTMQSIGDFALDSMIKIVQEMKTHVAAAGGHWIIDKCSPEWRAAFPVWSNPPADLALQKAVKRALDPQNIFNPGRFVTDTF